MSHGRITRERLRDVRERELARFAELRPRGMELLARARDDAQRVPNAWMAWIYDHPPMFVAEGHLGRFTDVDGNEYVDFNLADTSMFAGQGVEAVTRAVGERVAAGAQFLLPTEDALAVARALGERFGLPAWQFTLSATQANTEVMRLARAVTGRSDVLMFDGKYTATRTSCSTRGAAFSGRGRRGRRRGGCRRRRSRGCRVRGSDTHSVGGWGRA